MDNIKKHLNDLPWNFWIPITLLGFLSILCFILMIFQIYWIIPGIVLFLITVAFVVYHFTLGGTKKTRELNKSKMNEFNKDVKYIVVNIKYTSAKLGLNFYTVDVLNNTTKIKEEFIFMENSDEFKQLKEKRLQTGDEFFHKRIPKK